MKRTLIAVGLGTIALSLLVAVAMQSGTVSADVHIAQDRVTADTALVTEDFNALLGTLESAWDARQAPGEAAHALASRMIAAPPRLREAIAVIPGSAGQTARIRNSFETFESALDQAEVLADELLADQTAYGHSITTLRDYGPAAVQNLRDLGLERAAADLFELVVGTLDFATTGNLGQEYELRRLLVTLERDQQFDAAMSRELETIGQSIATILDDRPDIESKLRQLGVTAVADNAANLDAAVQDTYRASVSRVDRARWMLAVYSLALFAAVAFVAYRLKESYKELNRANTQLAALNESLEQRVTERTEELEGALADLKESQVQLVQAEKMSSLGQLVAGISHEINTPLLYLANNVVLIRERLDALHGFVELAGAPFALRPDTFTQRAAYQKAFRESLTALKRALRASPLDEDIEEARDLLADCEEGLKDLTEIAQSLKDFSRLDRAPVGNFNVNAGLDKTLLIAKNLVKHKAEVIKEYGDVPEISCSPSKINQVFLNLISNAAQAIEETGEITLTTKRHDDAHVAVSIRDTGSGIPKEIIDKIRDPFFTTKDVGTGTGLGLSIVDEIVRSHHGKLLIESELGKGSTFTVVLPIKRPDKPNRSGAHAHVPAETEPPTSNSELARAS